MSARTSTRRRRRTAPSSSPCCWRPGRGGALGHRPGGRGRRPDEDADREADLHRRRRQGRRWLHEQDHAARLAGRHNLRGRQRSRSLGGATPPARWWRTRTPRRAAPGVSLRPAAVPRRRRGDRSEGPGPADAGDLLDADPPERYLAAPRRPWRGASTPSPRQDRCPVVGELHRLPGGVHEAGPADDRALGELPRRRGQDLLRRLPTRGRLHPAAPETDSAERGGFPSNTTYGITGKDGKGNAGLHRVDPGGERFAGLLGEGVLRAWRCLSSV